MTLLLSREDIAALMRPADYLHAVENAFIAGSEGRAQSPAPIHLPTKDSGGFHAKAASLFGARAYVALKFNGNFPGNPERTGLPTIQGAILLCDAQNGAVLAVLDSIEITLRRTAAASALAARHLARPDAETLSICGCGGQARAQAEALCDVIAFKRGFAWDIDTAKARTLATELSAALDRPFVAASEMRQATAAADVIVTCTTARAPFLTENDVKPGTFIAAVGADNPEKAEITPSLMAQSAIVVDTLGQCVAMGDLRSAIAAGMMRAEDVRAELADVLTGARVVKARPDEIIIFDSTGTALQDVATAALAYERACERAVGVSFTFA